MIYVQRSTDLDKDTFWVAARIDEEARRCYQLYLGKDVNGAIAAAVEAGLPREEAVAQAQAALARDKLNDEIRHELPWDKPSKNGLLVHSEV